MAEIHCRRCTLPIVPGDSDEASVCPLDGCKVQFQELFPAVGAELLPPEPERVPTMQHHMTGYKRDVTDRIFEIEPHDDLTPPEALHLMLALYKASFGGDQDRPIQLYLSSEQYKKLPKEVRRHLVEFMEET